MARESERSEARRAAQPWEAGYQTMMDGLRQTQEFWANLARTWTGSMFPWAGAGMMSEEYAEVLRDLQDATFQVSQAWLRLPLIMVGAASPSELAEATTRLTEAQTRAYQSLMDVMMGQRPTGGGSGRGSRGRE